MSTIDAENFQHALLHWYDRNARVLPWRIPPGKNELPDPYLIWLSEIMLQQTVVATVKAYFEKFTQKWPTVEALANASDEDVLVAWAGLGYYARARNLIACARAVSARGGFPDTEEDLLRLPGIGPYTAAAIASIAFDRPGIVVDGNIERVMARLFAVETRLPGAKPELKRHAATLTPTHRPGDHAQALMDIGATVCRPKSAVCLACPVQPFCAASGNDPERLPLKQKKAPKPERTGTAWWLTHDGHVLLVTRPPKGLLGGMCALPASEFRNDFDSDPCCNPDAVITPPLSAEWTRLPHPVTHVFTHFRLTLTIMSADISGQARPDGNWTPLDTIDHVGLPTLFTKAARLALAYEGTPV